MIITGNIKTLNITAQYLGKCREARKLYRQYIDNDKQRALCVRSGYGTGKTYILTEYIKKYLSIIETKEKRAGRLLVISTRQSYARAMCSETMKELNINNYLEEDKETLYRHNRLCVSMEGLYGLTLDRWKPYDVVILDESESIARHMFSSTIKNGAYSTYETLKMILSKSKKIFLLDADLCRPSLHLIGQFKEEEIIIINNHHRNIGREYYTTYNKEEFINEIKADIIQNNNVYIVCLSATEADNLKEEFKDMINIYNKKMGVYYGEAGDIVKKELQDVNINWSKLNMVITTSTTGAGIDYNIKGHFNKIYGFISAGCACPAEFLQIINRVRHPINNNILLLLDSKLKLPFNPYEKEHKAPYIHTIENSKVLLDDLNKHIINNTVYYTFEDEEGYINNKTQYVERCPDFSYLAYYNYLNNNLNNTPATYTTILKQIIESQNNNIYFDFLKVSQKKVINNKQKNIINCKIKNENVNEIYQKIEKTENEKRILTKNKIKKELKINNDFIDGEEAGEIVEIMLKTSKKSIIKNLKECYIKPEYVHELQDTEKLYTDETQRVKDLRLNLFKRIINIFKYDYTPNFEINTETMKEHIQNFEYTEREKNIITRNKLNKYEFIRSVLSKYGFNVSKVLNRENINGKKTTQGVKYYLMKPKKEIFNILNLLTNNSGMYDVNICNLSGIYTKYSHLQTPPAVVKIV